MLQRPVESAAKSRPSSKEFICSVRPSLNDRFRLQAAVQALEFRQAATDPLRTFAPTRVSIDERTCCHRESSDTDGLSMINLVKTSLRLEDGPSASPIAEGQEREDHPGRIVGIVETRQPEDLHPSMWEMHPDGDEVMLVSSCRIIRLSFDL